MKKAMLILAMLLMAATTFPQTSRRPANNTGSANERENRQNTAPRSSASQQQNNTRKTTVNRNAPVQNSEDIRQEPGRQPEHKSTRQQPQRGSTTNRPEQRAQPQPDGNNNRPAHRTQQHNDGSRQPASVNRSEPQQRKAAVHNRESQQNKTVVVKKGHTNVVHYESPRAYRGQRTVVHHYHKPPRPAHYRAKRYPYRAPVHVGIVWTPAMHREYVEIYPMVTYWRYPTGYHIGRVSAYHAMRYRGEVMNVYGRVDEVYYAQATDEYIMYFGAYYPYHDFSIVVPGIIARRLSAWPERYFESQYISVTGLITTFEGKPEIVVRRRSQLDIY